MKWAYYILLLGTSILYAGNFVAGKFLVGHATPLFLTLLRWGIAVVCLIPIVWMKDKKLLPDKRAWFPLFVMGLTGVVLFNWFMYLALERTTADNAGLISALNPIGIAVISFFVLKERVNLLQIWGMIVSLIGVAVVISHGELQHLAEMDVNLGDFFMILAVIMWGLYSVAGKKAMAYTSPYMSTLWAGIIGSVILFPFITTTHQLRDTGTAFWIAQLYTSVGATVAAMVFWNIGVHKVGGTNAGVFLNFNPIFTAILSFFLIGETVTWGQVLGTVLVIGGVLLFIRFSRWRKKRVVVHQQAS